MASKKLVSLEPTSQFDYITEQTRSVHRRQEQRCTSLVLHNHQQHQVRLLG